MTRAGRGLPHGRIPPATRHQTDCGRIPNVAIASVVVAEASASRRDSADRHSSLRARERTDDGEDRAHPVFQPNNGAATHTRSTSEYSVRFSLAALASAARHRPAGVRALRERALTESLRLWAVGEFIGAKHALNGETVPYVAGSRDISKHSLRSITVTVPADHLQILFHEIRRAQEVLAA